MTTIVTKPGSESYAIYVNGEKVVQCNSPETTFNELVKALKLDRNVQIIELTDFPKTLDMSNYTGEIKTDTVGDGQSLDNAIDSFNAEMTAKNLSAYKKTGYTPNTDSASTDSTSESIVESSTVDSADVNAPVGSVKNPELGDLVYVDGMSTMLRVVLGGVGTVAMVHNEEKNVSSDPDLDIDEDDPDYNDRFDDDTSTDATMTSGNVLIELEEAPGAYFSWKELRDRQNELQTKYGHRPAQVIR